MASVSLTRMAVASSWTKARTESIVRSSRSSASFSVVFKSSLNAATVSNNSRSPSSGRLWKNARIFQINTSSSVPAEGTEEQEKEELEYLGELRVPQDWVDPDVAAREAEWLRVALHQWLDDEFCPEPANEEISKRCSKVYYYCLLEQQLDVGDILMQMVSGLETFSFKESFHGSFSSANAAIDLITKRMKTLSLDNTDSTLDSTVE